jgi:lysyl-tRNA synthetase class I
VDNFIILCEKCGKVYTVRMDNATGKYVVSHNIDIVCTMV